jgi:hypothetical protein
MGVSPHLQCVCMRVFPPLRAALQPPHPPPSCTMFSKQQTNSTISSLHSNTHWHRVGVGATLTLPDPIPIALTLSTHQHIEERPSIACRHGHGVAPRTLPCQ